MSQRAPFLVACAAAALLACGRSQGTAPDAAAGNADTPSLATDSAARALDAADAAAALSPDATVNLIAPSTRPEPPWQARQPGVLTVKTAGRGPKRLLRYDIAPGTSQRSILEAKMDLNSVGPAFVRPTIVMEFTTVAGTPVQGGVSFAQTFDKFYAKAREIEVIPPAMAEEQIVKFTGLALSGRLAPDGTLRGVTVQYPAAIPDNALPTAQGLLRTVHDVMPQLPSTPVGVGAAWTITHELMQDGVKTKMTTEVRLTAMRGSKVTLKGSTTIFAPPLMMQREGQWVKALGVKGKGTSTIELDLQKPLPTAQQTLEMEIDLATYYSSKLQLTLTSPERRQPGAILTSSP